MIALTKKSSSGRTSQNHFIYFDENPHPQSWASRLLLKNELMYQDEDFILDDLATWLEFREQYLTKELKKNGDLVCKYCGKKHLEIGGRTPKDLSINNKNKNLATIDHIVALSNGGEKYSEANMCVCCKKCNSKKGNKSADALKQLTPVKKTNKMKLFLENVKLYFFCIV